MKTHLDCFPCTCHQALQAARYVTDDLAVQERVLRSVMKAASEMDMSASPPAVAATIHRHIRELTGNPDPYLEAKRHSNRVALELLPRLHARLDGDPLEQAVRLAITGNIIDFASRPELAGPDLGAGIEAALDHPFVSDGLERFRQDIASAGDILVLGDNAGEIVFDRPLLEQLPPGRVTYVVKAGPIINDATREDAETAGIPDLAAVIDSGSDAPGTILELCSAEFRERFWAADLVIAKGQANYETLSEVEHNIYFLLMAKCAVVADDLGVPVNSLVLRRSDHD